MIEGKWVDKADMFVMPGGGDLDYCKHLNGEGNRIIREFVRNGGMYVGICAGSYYGCANIEFDKGLSSEVCGSRELAFFAGREVGPLLAPYEVSCNSGARAAKVSLIENIVEKSLEEKEMYLYSNGGGYFEMDSLSLTCPVKGNEGDAVDGGEEVIKGSEGESNTDAAKNVRVIGRYVEKENLPAILEVRYGSGVAILSAVHFECSFAMLNPKDTYVTPLLKTLEGSDSDRLAFVQYIIHLAKELFQRFLILLYSNLNFDY